MEKNSAASCETAVECAWEINEIIISVRGMPGILLMMPVEGFDKFKDGTCGEGQFALDVKKAELFIGQLQSAMKQYKLLDKLCEDEGNK